MLDISLLHSWLDTAGTLTIAAVGVANLGLLVRAGQKIAVLTHNTNGALEALNAAKDATAAAQVGEASALGAERGRTEEIARQVDANRETRP